MEDNHGIVVNFLQRQFGIVSSELEKTGHDAIFERVATIYKEQTKSISGLKNKIRDL
jgi:hypothetical protein